MTKQEVTAAVQKAFAGLLGETVDTVLTARVRDALNEILVPIAARRAAEWDRFVEWENTSTEEDEAQGRLNMKARLLPGAPDHVREMFEKMSASAN